MKINDSSGSEQILKILGMEEKELNEKINEILKNSKTTNDIVKNISEDDTIENKIAMAFLIGAILITEKIINV